MREFIPAKDRRYTVKWSTGDEEKNLTYGELLQFIQEHGGEWVEGNIVKGGEKVAKIIRTDPY